MAIDRFSPHRLRHLLLSLLLANRLAFSPLVPHANAGITERIESEIHESKPPDVPDDRPKAFKEPERERAPSVNFDDDDTSDSLDTATFFLLAGAMSAPIWAPRAIIDDEGLEKGYFRRYPFHHDADGFVSKSDSQTGRSRNWFLRAGIDGVTDFDEMQQLRGQMLLDTTIRLGLDAEIKRLAELDPPQDDESLLLGDFNLLVRFAQSEKLQMRSGIGLNWLTHDSHDDYGFNFTYSGDWFPGDPFIVSGELDWGKVGEADLFHFRSTVGLHYHRAELFSGFDYLNVEGIDIPGLVIGIRLWL